MVDRATLERKIFFIHERVRKLKILQQRDKVTFLSDFEAVDATKYNLQVTIEAIIDAATHIVAREKWGIPATSADAVKSLQAHGIIDETLLLNTLQMIKFRNRIVHLYQEVDDGQIYDILQSGIADIENFVAQIGRQLPGFAMTSL